MTYFYMQLFTRFLRHFSTAEDYVFYFSEFHDESSSMTDAQLIKRLKSNYKKLSNSHHLPT